MGLKREKSIAAIMESAIANYAAEAKPSIYKIARDAGLPKANIHYYFRGKDELYRAVVAHAQERPAKTEHARILARHWIDMDDLERAEKALNLTNRKEQKDGIGRV